MPAIELECLDCVVPTVIQPGSWRDVPFILADGRGESLLSVDRDIVVRLFKFNGAVLFRSFSFGVETFQALVKAYSSAQVSYPGSQRADVSHEGKVQTVDIGLRSIPLHSELSHTPFRPDVCWFYCVKAAAQGSETILCDGSLLASSLPGSFLRQLERTRLRYRRTTPIEFLMRILGTADAVSLCESLKAGPYDEYYEIRGDEVRQDFTAPALHIPKFLRQPVFANNIIHNFRAGRPLLYPTFEDGSIIPEDLIIGLRELARSCTLEIDWRDNDLLMLDNTRFMHGRRAVVDPQRTLWTQFSDAKF